MRAIQSWLLALALCGIGGIDVDAQVFSYTAVDRTIQYDLDTGAGSDVVQIMYHEYEVTPGYPHQVSGWSLSLAHDPALLSVLNVQQGEYIAALNGGDGPAFFSPTFLPNGVGVGCVYSFFGSATCSYEIEREVALIEYGTVPSALAGDLDGETTSLEWVEQGSPIIQNVIVVAGVSLLITAIPGTIELIVGGRFLRGDCNQDGVVNIADPIFLGNALFGSGETILCADACDGNDDGLVDIADVIFVPNHLFADGPVIPAPFPSCGTDPTDGEPLDCFSYAGCP